MIVTDFNTSLLVTYWTVQKKNNWKNLDHTCNELDLNWQKEYYIQPYQNTGFNHETLIKIDNILGHKIILNKFQIKTEIIKSMTFDHTGNELENNRTFQENSWEFGNCTARIWMTCIKEEITIKIGKYFNWMIRKIQQYMNCELPDVQAGFRKGRGTRDQIANICWIIKKAREYQRNIYFCFIDYTKAFDFVDHNKLENSSRDGNTRPPYLPSEKSVCRSRSNS